MSERESLRSGVLVAPVVPAASRLQAVKLGKGEQLKPSDAPDTRGDVSRPFEGLLTRNFWSAATGNRGNALLLITAASLISTV
jgi:hypothetical protein